MVEGQAANRFLAWLDTQSTSNVMEIVMEQLQGPGLSVGGLHTAAATPVTVCLQARVLHAVYGVCGCQRLVKPTELQSDGVPLTQVDVTALASSNAVLAMDIMSDTGKTCRPYVIQC